MKLYSKNFKTLPKKLYVIRISHSELSNLHIGEYVISEESDKNFVCWFSERGEREISVSSWEPLEIDVNHSYECYREFITSDKKRAEEFLAGALFVVDFIKESWFGGRLNQ